MFLVISNIEFHPIKRDGGLWVSESDLQTSLTVLISEGERKLKTCSNMTGYQNFFSMAACLQAGDTRGNDLISLVGRKLRIFSKITGFLTAGCC